MGSTVTNTLKTILIIDDDESSRQLIARHINQTLPGVKVEEYDPAMNGPPPSTFDWTGCDLIILDYLLSEEQNGLELLNLWKKQDNFPPVIMLTGKGSEEIAVRAMKTGVQDYMRKQDIAAPRLKQSIIDAVENHRQARERQSLNIHGIQSFNKVLFYTHLEQATQSQQPDSVFFLLELDGYTALGDERGLIVQDDILRHIASLTFDAFSDPAYKASITRMSDATVGLLFEPGASQSLESEIARLKEVLAAHPYDHEGEAIPITVSIGVVRLKDAPLPADDIIRSARLACQTVRDRGGDGYEIHSPETAPPAARTDRGQKQPPVRETPEMKKKPVPEKTPQAAAESEQPAQRSPPPLEPETEKNILELTLELPIERQTSKAASEIRSVELAEGDLGAPKADEFDILQAFNDNRVLQYFQPIMPLSDTAAAIDAEMFSVFVRMVNTDGSIIEADQVIKSLITVRNQQLLDRWMLRESVGRMLHVMKHQDHPYTLFVKISGESFADANLFTWLQNKLMKKAASKEPCESIVLEVAATTYLARQKQIDALFKYLRQTYGFRFAITSFESLEQLQQCVNNRLFDVYEVRQSLLGELQEKQSDSDNSSALATKIKQQDALLVSTFIENSAMLTEAISCGADFAMGFFIGAPVDQIGGTLVESYEIT